MKRTLNAVITLSLLFFFGPGEIKCESIPEAVDSLKALEISTKANPKDWDAWLRLGNAYLDAEEWRAARKAFNKVTRKRSAQAYNGIGLSYLKSGDTHRALRNFRRALSKDKTSLEIQMNLARGFVQMRHPEADKEFKKVIAMDSTYVPAYQELADWYADLEYFEELAELYRSYLKICPEDRDAHYQLALNEVEKKRFPVVLQMCDAARESNVYENRWLPLEAQAQAAQGNFDRSLALFRGYLTQISAQECGYYEDLSLVATPEELAALEGLGDRARAAHLKRFWQKRDVTLVSGGKARRVEHYRRVWYARTFLSEGVVPYDRRGEVYIRYGEPDYRSYGYKATPLPPTEVSYMVERKYMENLVDVDKSWQELPPHIKRAKMRVRRNMGLLAPNIQPITTGSLGKLYQTDKIYGAGSWEAWFYVNIGGGVEFVFVPSKNGWDFAPVNYSFNDRHMIKHFFRDNPKQVYERVSSKTPEYYRMPFGMEPLDFYYDLAAFKKTDTDTQLDVYYGVPLSHLKTQGLSGMEQIHISRSVVISNHSGATVGRSDDEMQFRVTNHDDVANQFCVDVAKLDVPPGNYRMAVKLSDQVSGKWGIYVQELEILAFVDTLMLSDLMVANAIVDHPLHEKFRKGDVWVIPMPSRSFLTKQNPHLYYEVYNLKRDEFGQTHYRVEYTVRRDVREGVGIFGALATVVRKLIATGKPEVKLSYEHTGSTAFEPIYFELQSSDVSSGLHEVDVRLTDLNSDRVVEKQAMFMLGQQTLLSESKAKEKQNAADFQERVLQRDQEQERERLRREQEERERERMEQEAKRRQNQ